MKQVEFIEIYKKCPKCGNIETWYYSELDFVGKTDDVLNYKQVVYYICRNQDCKHRWEKSNDS